MEAMVATATEIIARIMGNDAAVEAVVCRLRGASKPLLPDDDNVDVSFEMSKEERHVLATEEEEGLILVHRKNEEDVFFILFDFSVVVV